jgi:hypothetical protein
VAFSAELGGTTNVAAVNHGVVVFETVVAN